MSSPDDRKDDVFAKARRFGLIGDPNDPMDDFPLIRDAGEPQRKANGHDQDPPPATDESEYGADSGNDEPIGDDHPPADKAGNDDATASADPLHGSATAADAISREDFRAYMPQHSYIFMPTRELWPAASVNARLPTISGPDGDMKPAKWLDINRPVEQMTWAPGQPELIGGRLISHGGWIERPDCSVFNLYRAPNIKRIPGDVALWLDLVRKVFPDQADHIVLWLAHRVQRPHEKINHCMVLGGKPGIGKDTILEPVKQAIGPWNFADVSPKQVLGRFSGFLKAVILRINEARDLGEFDRYAFHDHTKNLIAAPPDVLRIDEKNIREYYIFNLCGVIITTNYKTDGIYLPADDRRHFVAWSNLTKDDFEADYWRRLYRWYARGGIQHIAAYLADLDISSFDPKAPPPKTAAFWDIVDANRAPEDAELADVLERLGNPDAVTASRIVNEASGDLAAWLRERKNRRQMPHRFESCGYTPIRNDAAKDGLWKFNGSRQVIYAKTELTQRDRIAAARRLI